MQRAGHREAVLRLFSEGATVGNALGAQWCNVHGAPYAQTMLASDLRRATVDFSKLSREDWMVGGGGILLIIGLLAFPWFSVSAGPYTFTYAATSATGGIWAVLGLIVLIAVVVDLVLARFSPATQIPTTQLGRDMTRAAGVGLVAVLMIIKLISHTSNFGWGFFVDIVLLIVVAAGAWLNAQGRTTPVSAGSSS
jgi:hypothetical protein